MKPIITAIVAPEGFTNWLISRCIQLNLHKGQQGKWHCHHVTLAYNKPWNRDSGYRTVRLTHVGSIEDRVVAFKVEGADDSLNATPHITAFVANGSKPSDSNNVTDWNPIQWGLQFQGLITKY